MTDQKLIADIFNSFMTLYLGKGEKTLGIKPLCKQYENHPMLLALLSNMDEATKVPVPQVMKEVYQVYRKYRGEELKDKDWQDIIDVTRDISMKWKENKWCNRIIVQMICLLEADDKERRQKAKEVNQDDQSMRQIEKDAA